MPPLQAVSMEPRIRKREERSIVQVSDELLSRTSAIDRGCAPGNGNDATGAETAVAQERKEEG
jgi:hypothetical protein